jgi:hypothetical protein
MGAGGRAYLYGPIHESINPLPPPPPGVDAGLASGLSAVRGYDGDVEDLGLTFSAEYDNFGRVRGAVE